MARTPVHRLSSSSSENSDSELGRGEKQRIAGQRAYSSQASVENAGERPTAWAGRVRQSGWSDHRKDEAVEDTVQEGRNRHSCTQ